MFKIGRFSQLVRVSPRMLRYYEKCGLFFPAEIDKVNGYRLYSTAQIPLLLKITALRDMGFNIDEISEILEHFDEKDYIEKVLEGKTSAIQASIAEESGKLERVYAMRGLVGKGYYTPSHEVVLKEIPAIMVLSLREIVPDYSYQEDLWRRLYAFIDENGLYPLLGENVIAIYHEMEYKDEDVDIEVAITVKELGESKDGFVFKELEPILAATVICDGSYDKILPEGEGILGRWVEDNGYEIVGSERGFGIRHPGNEQDPQNYRTEIQFHVEKNKRRE